VKGGGTARFYAASLQLDDGTDHIKIESVGANNVRSRSHVLRARGILLDSETSTSSPTFLSDERRVLPSQRQLEHTQR
jgi:hypothetical protein